MSDHTDMDTYYLLNDTNLLVRHSYGDSSFAVKLSDYYIGPDMRFKAAFNSSTYYSDDIVLPVVVNTIEGDVITRKLKTENE